MPKGRVSTPAGAVLPDTEPGTVARLVDRLIQQDPRAQVRFRTVAGMELHLLSVYADERGVVWVDVGVDE